jgi:HSP20 family protein
MNWILPTPLAGRTLARSGGDAFSSLQREINRVFENILDAAPMRNMPAAAAAPLRLDVNEDEKAFHVTADLPGLNEKDVEVTFQDGNLTIRGEKKVERDEKKDTWHIVERSYGSFARQLGFPSNVDAEKIDAKFDKGVLTVTLPKMPDEKAKKIEVKVG